MSAVLFRNVTVFDLDAPGCAKGPLDVLVQGGRFTKIANGIRAPENAVIVDGAGKLLAPGLINGHFHSSVNHAKGSLPGLPLEIFMLYESPALDVLRPTPREAYVRTMLGALEMIRTGVTSVQDDAFFVPEPSPEIIDAVMQAYADCGIRATVALDQPGVPEIEKLPFLDTLLPDLLIEELSKPPKFGEEQLVPLYREFIRKWNGACDGRLRCAVSCSAPQRVTTDYLLALDEMSKVHDIPFYAHILETRVQRVFGQEKLGHSLVRHMAERGLLSHRLNIIHAIWVDDDDLDLIAASGATVAHNPVSNLRLGSGIMPFRKMRERGVNICIGTDEAIADDAVNMWGAMKSAALLQTLTQADYELWPDASEILECVTRGGAQAMLHGDSLGRIAEGCLADAILIDLDTLAFTPLNNLARQMIFCETGSSVELTMVAGRIVFQSGRVTGVDEKSLRAEARQIFQSKQSSLDKARLEADRWLPYYREMYLRAARTPVGMRRRLDEI